MAVSSGKTAFGHAMTYTLSKVGKPEMVLKNEQLTATQHVYNGKDVFVWLLTGYPSLSINATRNIGPKRPRRLACSASMVNKLVPCFASSSKRQKQQRYFKAILLHAEVAYFPHIFPLTASYISR